MVRPHALQPAQRQALGAIVLIMHRLHEGLTGHVLAQEPWEMVCVSAIADEASSTGLRPCSGASPLAV